MYNTGTIKYQDITYQTHTITLWRDELKKTVNNVIEYEFTTYTPNLFNNKFRVYGYITSIQLNKMETRFIKLSDDYDKYELENNVGTVKYQGYTIPIHKVILSRGDSKITINNVAEYHLRTTNI